MSDQTPAIGFSVKHEYGRPTGVVTFHAVDSTFTVRSSDPTRLRQFARSFRDAAARLEAELEDEAEAV